MSLSFDKLYPAAPLVERGKRVVIGAHPKGGFIVYPNQTNVIIRDISGKMENDCYTGHSTEVHCAKYSPSGFYVASGDKMGNLHQWDTTQKEHVLRNEFRVLSSTIKDVAWSSDNQRIAVGGIGNELLGKVITADSGNSVGEISGMSKAINAIDFKPTRPFRVATASEDFLSCFFEGPPFRFKKSSKSHSNFVQCCRFSPKGDIYVTGGSDGKIFVYDATSGEEVGQVGSPAHKGGIYGLDFSPSGERLLSVSADKKVKLWKTESPFDLAAEYAFEDTLENMQLGCVWAPGKVISLGLGGDLSCFDVADDCSNLDAPSSTLAGHIRPIQRSAYVPAEDQLITASYDGRVVRWNLSTGEAAAFRGKEAHKTSITGVVTNGDRVATIGADDRFVVASLSKLEYETSMKLASQPRALQLANDGVAVVVCQSHLYLFNLSATNPVSPVGNLLISSSEATAGAISAAGNIVAVGHPDGGVEVYSVVGGNSFAPAGGSKVSGEVTSMSFSPDGGYLAVGDSNRYVHLFKVDGTTLTEEKNWRSHAARVTCVAWSTDGAYIASGGLDCAIVIYKPTSNSKICDARNAHPASLITSIVWKSATELVSTGQDACVRSWKFKPN